MRVRCYIKLVRDRRHLCERIFFCSAGEQSLSVSAQLSSFQTRFSISISLHDQTVVSEKVDPLTTRTRGWADQVRDPLTPSSITISSLTVNIVLSFWLYLRFVYFPGRTKSLSCCTFCLKLFAVRPLFALSAFRHRCRTFVTAVSALKRPAINALSGVLDERRVRGSSLSSVKISPVHLLAP